MEHSKIVPHQSPIPAFPKLFARGLFWLRQITMYPHALGTHEYSLLMKGIQN